MYYELYVDVLFLVNFVMDFLLLSLVRRMLQLPGRGVRKALGAGVGAVLTCLGVVAPLPVWGRILWFYLLVNTIIVVVGLKIRTIRMYVISMVLFYIGTILMGGFMEMLRPYIKEGSLFLAMGILGYYLIEFFWDFLGKVRRDRIDLCQVELYLGEKKLQVQALLDTGNRLRDPVSQKPVSVIERRVLEPWLEKDATRRFYIPYRCVGKANGILEAVEIDRIHILAEKEIRIEKPMIALSEEVLSETEDYQLILNPNLCDITGG